MPFPIRRELCVKRAKRRGKVQRIGMDCRQSDFSREIHGVAFILDLSHVVVEDEGERDIPHFRKPVVPRGN